jgi:hypothetical protein
VFDAASRATRANAEIVHSREQLKVQVSAQTAKLKQIELKCGQLERQLEIRVCRHSLCIVTPSSCDQEKDNAELTAICDDLVRQLEAASAK